MSPSDKVIAGTKSNSGESHSQVPLKSCKMDSAPHLSLKSTTNSTLSGTISSIPLITASLSTFKCSISDQMKTFDPGEKNAFERLIENNCEKGGSKIQSIASSSGYCGLIKNVNKNYKAGSKINKLADMLAKRSQNVVEVIQNNSSKVLTGSTVETKTEVEVVTFNDVGDVANFGKSLNEFQKISNSNELDLCRKNRRKSVPNQSCNFSQLKIPSMSKSCLDLSKLFSAQEIKENSEKKETKDVAKGAKDELNALGKSMLKLQTDKSTKRKAIRKNLKNVELTLILPEKKKRFSSRVENHCYKLAKGNAPSMSDEINQMIANFNETSSLASPISSISSTNLKREIRGKHRKSKRLVEMSTQTADIEFVNLMNAKKEEDEVRVLGAKDTIVETECIRCSKILPLVKEFKDQTSKTEKFLVKCQFCPRKTSTLDDLKLHCVKKHPNKYVYCLKCVAEENVEKYVEQLESNKSLEQINSEPNETVTSVEERKIDSRDGDQLEKTANSKLNLKKGDLKVDVTYDGNKKSSVSPRNIQKCSPKEMKTEEQLIEMEMLFYSHLSGNIQENLANHLDGKMRKNGCPISTDAMAGSTGSSLISGGSSAKIKNFSSFSFTTNDGPQETGLSRAPSPYKTRSKTPNPLPPPTAKKFKKLPNWQQKFWEKYNFPTNYRYEHRFWDKNYLDTEKSALFLKDLSCLDIKTQLIMRENIKKLESAKLSEDDTIKSSNNFTFPEYLSLMPNTNKIVASCEKKSELKDSSATEINKGRKQNRKELPVLMTKTRKEVLYESKRHGDRITTDGKVLTRRQNSLDLLMIEDAEESARKRKGSLDLSAEKRMTLRRQTSADNLQRDEDYNAVEKASRMLEIGLTGPTVKEESLSPTSFTEISGEWVKPRSYLCGTCCSKFTNLWELEDHKWVSHPNVWCTHYEFEDEKIQKLFSMNEEGVDKRSEEASGVRLADLYKRYLLPHGTLKTAKLVPCTNYPEQCTKCKKNCMNASEMHKHILDCGGDTTWFLTMFSSPMTVKRKWRPFGSRRRKQIGRRDIKRNIPNTPNLRSYHYQHRIRTKPGDVESIQKMLANLPEKRTRRAINFDDIKTRSQVTIRSNRMLRKRFKSSFANNFLKIKTLKNRGSPNSGKKEGCSKSTTDTSSESTPVGSPKRRNRLKEAVQVLKDESGADVSNESSSDGLTATTGATKKRTESLSSSLKLKSANKKSGKQRKTQTDFKSDKSQIKNYNLEVSLPADKLKKKFPTVGEEVLGECFKNSNFPIDYKFQVTNEKETFKFGKRINKGIAEHNRENSKKESRITQIFQAPSNSSTDCKEKSDKKNMSLNSKVKERNKSGEKAEKRKNSCSRAVLRLKYSCAKEKSNLIKRMKKTLMNSKRILEIKENSSTASQNGYRRSLRLKSLQEAEDNIGFTDESLFQQTINAKNNDSYRKQPKMKKSLLEFKKLDDGNSLLRDLGLEKLDSDESMEPKTAIQHDKQSEIVKDQNFSKELKVKEISDKRRRSSRCLPAKKSILENEKVDENQDKLLNDSHSDSPTWRRYSKNVFDDTKLDDSNLIKNISKSKSFFEINMSGSQCLPFQNLTLTTSKKLPPSKKNNSKCSKKEIKMKNLEEMPVLAKMEPLQGMLCHKKEEEDIPVLLPATETEPGSALRFQIVKKRKTLVSSASTKEKQSVKVTKKIDSFRKKNERISFQSKESKESSDSIKSSGQSEKLKRKIVLRMEKEIVQTEPRPRKNCKKCNKYFLGICPCEIDKGREEANDDSGGSDSEPLIMLINQSHKKLVNASDICLKEKENEDVSTVSSTEENFPDESLKNEEVKELSEIKEVVTASVLVPEQRQVEFEKMLCFSQKTSESSVEKIEIDDTVTESKGKKKKSIKKIKCEAEKKLPFELTANPTHDLNQPVQYSGEENNEKITVVPCNLKPDTQTAKEVLPERRSRRISKETKLTSEFVIDDPLILVDELWSDLDSDSDTVRKKSKRSRRKAPKKKLGDERKNCEVDLEELLRNFGEKKNAESIEKTETAQTTNNSTTSQTNNKADMEPLTTESTISIAKIRPKEFCGIKHLRKVLESRSLIKSFRRLSLRLFQFNKTKTNFGNNGVRLAEAKMACRGLEKKTGSHADLPDLPFLVAEIKENPVQVIQCKAPKTKPLIKKKFKSTGESRHPSESMHLKISLPLECINNLAVFNNNHLTEVDVEKEAMEETNESGMKAHNEKKQFNLGENEGGLEEPVEISETLRNKMKRSDVIDKIFYCEICQTYYYSSSQLKIHKSSNRHKVKETEMVSRQQRQEPPLNKILEEETKLKTARKDLETKKDGVSDFEKKSVHDFLESEKISNDDILEMPTLEGPFLENPVVREETVRTCAPPPPPSHPPVSNPFNFCQESLKDIQRAIGCTDEEMLILTLLGENTIEVENDILDLDMCKSVQSGKSEVSSVDREKVNTEKSNGLLNVDLKQRMTSALTCLVNKAIFNLLQKYENMAKTSVNPEVISLQGKLSSLSRRQNILQLNDLLKRQKEGEPSVEYIRKDVEKKKPTVSYKYQCTICGSRFEKASTRDCHISRTHKGKARKISEEIQVSQGCGFDDWSDYLNYDSSDLPGNASQFWCSDCGINFVSPQEVLEHQKLEHQAVNRNFEKLKEASPLQSSTIGSSDEIIEGKKSKRRSKVFSLEELDQQRIIANNELRKLDRKLSNKGKPGKVKWGMDALRFTVEKDKKPLSSSSDAEENNKGVEEKTEKIKEANKVQVDVKNLELVPKLNFIKTNNVSEFKVVQKNSLKNRFQNIIENKLKRKENRYNELLRLEEGQEEVEVARKEEKQDEQQEKCHLLTPQQSVDGGEPYETKTEVMFVPVVVKKKNRKPKLKSKKSGMEEDKGLDVYDFNESESEEEPVVLSHIKKPVTVPMKLKLVKVKEMPSKNKADSTTKDLIPDDYDSEDSLPLSIVRKWKPCEEEEKASEDGIEKADGILEQVEYLIEQLEHDTSTGEKKNGAKKEFNKNVHFKNKTTSVIDEAEDKEKKKEKRNEEFSKESLKVSLPTLPNLPLTNKTSCSKSSNDLEAVDIVNEASDQDVTAEQESTQSTFDEEDSIPLLLMSKRSEESNVVTEEVPKKCDENTMDVSASEDVNLFERKSSKMMNEDVPDVSSLIPQTIPEETPSPTITEESTLFESLYGNVIYCRNESVSNFESDYSNDGLIDSNYEKFKPETEPNENYLKEITEKEDVVIVCSKSDRPASKSGKGNRKRIKPDQKRKKKCFKNVQKTKKKIFPLLTATIEDNNFRRTNESKMNKKVIVRKIWNRKKLTEEENVNRGEDLFSSLMSGDHDDHVAIDQPSRNEESQTEIEKEVIVNKIWSRKKLDYDGEASDKPEDIKINQTEVSDEVIIKCGPKTSLASFKKRQKNKNAMNEASKETIMRKIWSGKCMFQTKAALKTYDSDMTPDRKDGAEVFIPSEGKRKKRGRPARYSSKKLRVEGANKDDEDDLDSLLEEIEREQLEKAIRLEFLHLRRSEKGNADAAKDNANATLGLFAETTLKHHRDGSDKKRKRMKRNLSRHPRQSLLKRKKFMKKPIRRTLPPECKSFSDKNQTSHDVGKVELEENCVEEHAVDTKIKSRKHKKHRHKHHHHKHKHKKSKHRKYLVSKHRNKYKSSDREEMEDEPEDEAAAAADAAAATKDAAKSEIRKPEGVAPAIVGPDTEMTRLMDTICQTIPGQMDSSNALQLPSPFTFEDSTKDCDDGDEQVPEKKKVGESVYDFAEEASDLSTDAYKCQN